MNSEVETHEGEVLESMPVAQAATTPPTHTDKVLTLLERVLTAPDFDIERAERLWAMQKEVRAEQAKAEYITALSAMQSKLPSIRRTGQIKNNSGQVQSTYAKWEVINDAIKPFLQEYGFALSFRVNQEGNKIIITGILSHRGTHQDTTTIELAPDTSGSKNAPQAVVSAISYGKRTAAGALLNITSHDEDDDGVKFGDREAADANEAKVQEFYTAISEADTVAILRDNVGKSIASSGLPPRLMTKVRQTYTARLNKLREEGK